MRTHHHHKHEEHPRRDVASFHARFGSGAHSQLRAKDEGISNKTVRLPEIEAIKEDHENIGIEERYAVRPCSS